MQHNITTPAIGLPFSSGRGERYLQREHSSAPGHQQGGAHNSATASEHPQSDRVSPGGSEYSTGSSAAIAEQGTEDTLTGDTTSVRGQGRKSPVQDSALRTGPKKAKSGRKPLLAIATLNVRGLGARRRREKNKLQESIRWMRSAKVGVLALQETYECEEVFAEAERFNGKIWAFPNPGGAHSAGTGFLVHREHMPGDLQKEDLTHEILIEGRLDVLSWKWGDNTVTLANLYAPNSSQVAAPFFGKVTDLLKMRNIDAILGDWNHVESRLDRVSEKTSTKEVLNALADLRRAVGVEDSWREENPQATDYTYESPIPNADGTIPRSRLDRILTSEEFAARTTTHDIDVSLTISDHYPVRMEVIDDEAPDQGSPRWRMNLEDLEDEHAMEKCRLILLACQKVVGKGRMTAWLKAKKSIRAMLMQRQAKKRKERGKHLSELKTRREALTKRADIRTNSGIRLEESHLQEKIATVTKGKLDRASESSMARFAEKGESVNKYWFSIGKSIRESSLIKALSTEDGETIRDTDRMAKLARDHHDTLQTKPPMTPERLTAIGKMEQMATGKRFTTGARAELDAETTTLEVEEAIRAAQTGKSPGKDGIPYEFYKYWVKRLKNTEPEAPECPDITVILAGVWNQIAGGYPPPPEYTEGLVFLLYKKKRRDKVANYRPITLLGCDYKLQTKVMTSRLGRNVSGVLNPDQAGFVPGRDILDHVKLAKHVKELCDTTQRDGVLVALDQEKAYDRVDHDYLWRMLVAFGLPPRFIATVQGLYKNATTRVLINQTESEPFNVCRGVRQGDPLSCLLFNLAIEPLAEALRRSTLKGISIPDVIDRLVVRLFADDTQIYLSKYDRWTKVTAITEEWCLASTAKFNEEKTEILPVGSARYRKEVCDEGRIRPDRTARTEQLPMGARLVRDHEPLRILGGIVGHKVDETQIWEPVVNKIEALADKWSKKRMTLKGRRLIISFLMQSKAQYLLATNDPPPLIIARIAKASHRVMWAGKKRGLTTMEVVERPIKEGGFGVPNFALRARTARLMTAKKWCSPDDERPLWADVVDEMIRLSTKKPDDPRQVSILTQTWRETSGKTSTLPRDVQAMLKDLRRYDVRAEALKMSTEVKKEMPIWLSRTTTLTLKEENSAAMRQLRRAHHVSTLGDLTRIQRNNADGCKKHLQCIKAADVIWNRTAPTGNLRFATPFLDAMNEPDNLDFTQRRTEKAREDAIAGLPTLLNPSVTHDGTIRNAVRIFGKPRPSDLLPAYRQGPARRRDASQSIWTDGSTTDFGKTTQKTGFGLWSEDGTIEVASKLTSEPRTNNRAELMAIVVALERAPSNVDLTIHTDSQYVTTGMTSTYKTWEDQGWINVPNEDAWRRALYLMRTRTATTEIEKVPAHTGLEGNEKADELAKAGADGDHEETPIMEVPARWTLQGAKISALTYSSTYEWVRRNEVKNKHTSATRNLERIREELEQLHGIRTTDEKVWMSLRRPYIRREISDFLWIMIHGRSQCGTMFSKWGGEWEEKQYCPCGAVESMEHILTLCDEAMWRRNLWEEMATMLKRSTIIPEQYCRPPHFSEIMGLGVVTMPTPEATRLWATIVSETAFTIWKLRNRSRFDEIRISTRMAKDTWRAALEIRAKTDHAAAKLKGPETAPEAKRRKEAVAAWDNLLYARGSVLIWNSADYG